jgi:hypothetical protein
VAGWSSQGLKEHAYVRAVFARSVVPSPSAATSFIPSTPWEPEGTPHDFMHAVTVADDDVFMGTFNLSRSGERNAEDVLEIEDSALADRLASYGRGVRVYLRVVPDQRSTITSKPP